MSPPHGPGQAATAIAAVKRELLVRHLDTWAPAALHSARRATFVQGYAGEDLATAEAALRVFAEFADLLRGRELQVVLIGADAATVDQRLGPIQRELGTPAQLSILPVDGDPSLLAVALKAAGAAGAPLLTYLDAGGRAEPVPQTWAAAAAGRPAELLLALEPPVGGPAAIGQTATGDAGAGFSRDALRRAGFGLVADVELVDESGHAELVVFATGAGRRLSAFKDALWSVDEYAGVRYRDPRDPDGHLLDISLRPHPGPLRRALVEHLRTAGERTVTQLREFTLTDTAYRAADATGALSALLGAGAVTRRPEKGRLAGDVMIGLSPGSS